MWLIALLAGCSAPPAHDSLPLAVEVAELGASRWAPDRQALDWIPTVWAFGLHRLSAASDDPAWRGWVLDWLLDDVERFTREPPMPFESSDSMSPALLASALLVDDPDAGVAPIVDAAWRYLDVADRTAEGAITHWGPSAAFGVPGQVWIDSQFMFGLFLLSEHARTASPEALSLWVEQYDLFSELCRDPATSLYLHAYDDASGLNIPNEPVFWARGNAWVLVSAAEALRALGPDHPALAGVLPAFQAHAAALIAAQDPSDGLWRTVLNAPEGDDLANYTETSGSALIAYGLAVGVAAGALDPAATRPVIDAAVDGIRGRVVYEDGLPVVRGTSFGTVPGDYAYYVGVPQRDDLMLGVGSVVLLLAEVHGTPQAAR